MKENLCPQCGHLKHLSLKETNNPDGSINCEGGCNVVTYLKPIEGGGYYHEHCDCDYEE